MGDEPEPLDIDEPEPLDIVYLTLKLIKLEREVLVYMGIEDYLRFLKSKLNSEKTYKHLSIEEARVVSSSIQREIQKWEKILEELEEEERKGYF